MKEKEHNIKQAIAREEREAEQKESLQDHRNNVGEVETDTVKHGRGHCWGSKPERLEFDDPRWENHKRQLLKKVCMMHQQTPCCFLFVSSADTLSSETLSAISP